MGIAFIDIEHFEAIEAEYGWAFFDEFLRRVGQALVIEAKERFRNGMVTAHRVGGSSFYVFFETLGQDLSQENALEASSNDLRQRLIDSVRERFPSMQTGQIGFFVGTTRIDYRPQIRLERQIYQGMGTASDAVRDAEQQRKKQLTKELRDIIQSKSGDDPSQPHH